MAMFGEPLRSSYINLGGVMINEVHVSMQYLPRIKSSFCVVDTN